MKAIDRYVAKLHDESGCGVEMMGRKGNLYKLAVTTPVLGLFMYITPKMLRRADDSVIKQTSKVLKRSFSNYA